MIRRVFLIVLDSVGAGALPDADRFGDAGAHTLRSVYGTGLLRLPHLCALGLGHIPALSFFGAEEPPAGAYGRLAERSAGKDTVTGHLELAGIVSDRPAPTFPDGFPADLIRRFGEAVGYPILCNRAFSGTEVLRAYGEESIRRRALIVYTSADSVFQVAGHASVLPARELHRVCEVAREMLTGDLAVGRVIARPFDGAFPFFRTPERRDLSLAPPAPTLLDRLSAAGFDVIGVGKIGDIFAGRGLTKSCPDHGNDACIARVREMLDTPFRGLCFVNLVDFDMLYGHRNDAPGYARALNAFDAALGEWLPRLQAGDLLMITADHGCDPCDASTDHTREYVPLLVCGPGVKTVDLSTRSSMCDVAATVGELFGLPPEERPAGESFAAEII